MVVALPPPFIGPSVAAQRLLQAANLRAAFEVLCIDISDKRSPDNIGRLDLVNVFLAIKHIYRCFMVLLLRRPVLLYLGISQGLWGYLRDLGFIIPALLLRRKVVIHLRGSEFDSFYKAMPGVCRWLTRIVFKRVATVIILGQSLKRVFTGLVADDRIAVIPNGIDYQQFDSVNADAVRKTRNTGGQILFLSSCRERKGIRRVIEALPDIFARHPEAHMTFTGQWRSANDSRQAMEFIQRHGLTEHITFTGEVVGLEKVQLYKQHDIFVFTPIEPEGLPWVILEAMSAGLPVVTSNQGAIAEVVQDGQTGFVVEPEPQEIAKKVCYLLEHLKEARVMGRRGRHRVARHFSEAVYLKAMEQVFHKVRNHSQQ
jgi:glycosyltransferase involved in cell wall biosynthesis